jgi:hypothetical protein
VADFPAAEPRSTRRVRWLRERSLRIALLVGVVEASLVILNVVGWFVAIAVAAAVWGLYLFVGRRLRPGALRELAWTAALSQAIPVLVPFLVGLVKFVALTAFVIFSLVVVAVLVLDRR